MSETRAVIKKELSLDRPLASQMIASPEAKALSDAAGGDADVLKARTLDFARRSKELGIDPFYWGAPMSSGFYGGLEGYAGAMQSLLWSRFSSKGLLALAESGASPWLISAQLVGAGTIRLMRSKDLAYEAMGDHWALSSRKIALKSALGAIPAAEAARFFPELLAAYEIRASKTSKTSKGVLGRSDKQAKECAAVVIHCKEELRRAAEAIARLGDSECPEASELAERLIAAATECLALKADKRNAAASPERIKKQATPEQRGAICKLIEMSLDFGSDDQRVRVAFEAAAWLLEHPMLASVSFGRRGSLFAAALMRGGSAALAPLERAGANIWLAAAQAGEGNACLWACKMMANGSRAADVGVVARLLMKGCWLDGAPEPKERCLELARQATEELSLPYYQTSQELSRGLCGELERLTLDELIGGSAPKPARRRASSL